MSPLVLLTLFTIGLTSTQPKGQSLTLEDILSRANQNDSMLGRSKMVVSTTGTRIISSPRGIEKSESTLTCERYRHDAKYMTKINGEHIVTGRRGSINSANYEMFGNGTAGYIHFPGGHIQVARDSDDRERYWRIARFDPKTGGSLFGGLLVGEGGDGMYRSVFELLEQSDDVEITREGDLVKLRCQLSELQLQVWLIPSRDYSLAGFELLQREPGHRYREFVMRFSATDYQNVGGRHILSGGTYSRDHETTGGERWRERWTATIEEIELFPSIPERLFEGATVEEGTPVRFAEDRESGIVTRWSGGKPEIDSSPTVAESVAQQVEEHLQGKQAKPPAAPRTTSPPALTRTRPNPPHGDTGTSYAWWVGGGLAALAAMGIIFLILKRG